MGDYDLQIMAAVVFASVLFGGFMFSYAQDPSIDSSYVSDNSYETWNETSQAWEVSSNPLIAIGQVFDLLGQMEETEIWIVGIFITAMLLIAVIIGLRFARGQ